MQVYIFKIRTDIVLKQLGSIYPTVLVMKLEESENN